MPVTTFTQRGVHGNMWAHNTPVTNANATSTIRRVTPNTYLALAGKADLPCKVQLLLSSDSDSESDSNSVSLYVVAEANLVSVEEQYVFYPRGVRAGRFVALRSIHGGIVLHVATLWHANANTSP